MSYHPLVINLDTEYPDDRPNLALHLPSGTLSDHDKATIKDLIESALRTRQERGYLEQAVPPTPRTNDVLQQLPKDLRNLIVARITGSMYPAIFEWGKQLNNTTVRVMNICAGSMLATVSLCESITMVRNPTSFIVQVYLSFFGLLLALLECPRPQAFSKMIHLWFRILETAFGRVRKPSHRVHLIDPPGLILFVRG
eukprot:Blabericola_migrator_1__10683@NODE_609_length_7298_cov_332_353616_g442_i0_p4_GENE_NODE_609_length_7298_cov_332_353616_g442_i0NODE_609_length_7298_cov_332_353616_g442_i0_p4_ORF_typecomplete_len197_score8_03COPI_assoc/PF08507_10/3e11YtpI/PF14007_6/0_18_NODE_609_length_7298_cov_332_353616_g442_i024513041